MADVTEYAATFDLIDADDDGMISAEEMVHLMEVLGQPITAEAARTAIATLDRNGDGLISLEEFAAYLSANAP